MRIDQSSSEKSQKHLLGPSNTILLCASVAQHYTTLCIRTYAQVPAKDKSNFDTVLRSSRQRILKQGLKADRWGDVLQVGMKQAATQSAHERLQAVAQRIKGTVDTDQAFYDDLRRYALAGMPVRSCQKERA